jgi:plasmid stabilization system protein ParE
LEEKDNNNERKQKFRTLLEESLATTKADHLPRLLANNIELIMSLQYGGEGAQVISELIEEAKAEGQEQFQRTVEVAETIVTFAEDFVEQASQMDDQNKLLLGKIIKTMTFKDYGDDAPRDREEVLDQLMEEEKENFTPGFLRHIEGECERIANAPKMTPESARLMEILRIIQTRVLEELGQDMGEAALVLGQLMGYENKDELLGVLDAGLTVRGKDFAFEMAALTEEALGGFQRVPGGVDPELVERVTFIDRRLREFLEETDEFQ